MEPLTVAAIAKLAFDEFVKAGAGEFGKQLAQATREKIKALRELIWKRLSRNPAAAAALQGIGPESEAELETVVHHLEETMRSDHEFGDQVRSLAQEIYQEIHIDASQGKSVQNIYEGGTGFQANDSKGPLFQGSSGNTININYGTPPQP